jgi:hypothetical protein
LLWAWHQHEFDLDVDGLNYAQDFPWNWYQMVATSGNDDPDNDAVSTDVNQVGLGSNSLYMQYSGPNSQNEQGSGGLGDTSGPSGMTGINGDDTGFAHSLKAQPFWFIIYMGDEYLWGEAKED